jgi:hypothetical protein
MPDTIREIQKSGLPHMLSTVFLLYHSQQQSARGCLGAWCVRTNLALVQRVFSNLGGLIAGGMFTRHRLAFFKSAIIPTVVL